MWQNSIETIIALGEGDRIVAGIGIPDRKYVRPEYREAYDKIPVQGYEIRQFRDRIDDEA